MAFTYTTTFNILIHKHLNRVGRKKKNTLYLHKLPFSWQKSELYSTKITLSYCKLGSSTIVILLKTISFYGWNCQFFG